MKKQKPQKTLKRLKAELDKVFSIYIRQRDEAKCFTCNVQKTVKEMQNGHYVSRGYLATRFEERNCHAQCVSCNIFKRGNYTIYSMRMIEKYGPQILSELDKISRLPVKYSSAWYENTIAYYKQRI